MNKLTRRQFLKLTALAAMGVAFRPLPPEESATTEYMLGRVIAGRISVRLEPSSLAKSARYLYRDQIISLRSVLISDQRPEYNRLWYGVAGGYVHSGWVQPVRYNFQTPLAELPGKAFLAEVSVPFTDGRAAATMHSERGYRYYYGSTHWVNKIKHDEEGNLWYRVRDDKYRTVNYVPGSHLRPITADEISPLSPAVADKILQVDISGQQVTAYENGAAVFTTRCATGKWYEINGKLEDYTTPEGKHKIALKMPSRHMAAGDLASGEGYDLPGVPWVSFFTPSGVAFHGTYWHNDFGRPRSHGCVNVPSEAAKWIYRWSLPLAPAHDDFVNEVGTQVVVV
jgi:hypothetical protein